MYISYPFYHSRGFPKAWTGTFTPLQTTPLLRCSVLAGDSRVLGEGMWLVEAKPRVEVPRESQCPLLTGQGGGPKKGVGPMSPHISYPHRSAQIECHRFSTTSGSSWDLASGPVFWILGYSYLGLRSESHLGSLGEYCHFSPAATETIPGHAAHESQSCVHTGCQRLEFLFSYPTHFFAEGCLPWAGRDWSW